ncbi:MAG: hypothetical protein EPN37_11595 [Chitinophagaceae bacterium]|nr:MAG: hypothetical protein EPN37_11595 [Chitinophagaceae bacterium]
MKKLPYLLFLLLIPWWGCRKDVKNAPGSGPATQTVGDLQFILETTDMNDNVQSVFKQGENFKLKLLIKNNSAQNITLCHCFLTQHPELLTVYAAEKITIPTKYGQQNIEPNDSVGRPWRGAGGVYIAPVTFVFPHSISEYSLPWSAPDTTVHYWAPYPIQYQAFSVLQNAPLPAGEYYTKFNFVYAEKSVKLKYYFQIQ